MVRVDCPRCSQPLELERETGSSAEAVECSGCGHRFTVGAEAAAGSETAVLQRQKPRQAAMLDLALVGHLRVSGSVGLEAPSALPPGKTIVGREAADMTIADDTLSARHFEIDSREGAFFIRDLGSTNGTRLNGQLLNQTTRLENGDRIRAGKTVFIFRTLETIPWSPSTPERS